MTEPAGLGARLRADPDAELIDFGGTRDLYFFGLATEPAGYHTVLVSDSTEARRSTTRCRWSASPARSPLRRRLTHQIG